MAGSSPDVPTNPSFSKSPWFLTLLTILALTAAVVCVIYPLAFITTAISTLAATAVFAALGAYATLAAMTTFALVAGAAVWAVSWAIGKGLISLVESQMSDTSTLENGATEATVDPANDPTAAQPGAGPTNSLSSVPVAPPVPSSAPIAPPLPSSAPIAPPVPSSASAAAPLQLNALPSRANLLADINNRRDQGTSTLRSASARQLPAAPRQPARRQASAPAFSAQSPAAAANDATTPAAATSSVVTTAGRGAPLAIPLVPGGTRAPTPSTAGLAGGFFGTGGAAEAVRNLKPTKPHGQAVESGAERPARAALRATGLRGAPLTPSTDGAAANDDTSATARPGR